MDNNIVNEQCKTIRNRTVLLILIIGITVYVVLYFYLVYVRDEHIGVIRFLITLFLSINSLYNLWAYFEEKTMYLSYFVAELDQSGTRIACFIYSLFFLALSLAIVYYVPVNNSV